MQNNYLKCKYHLKDFLKQVIIKSIAPERSEYFGPGAQANKNTLKINICFYDLQCL